MEPTAYRRRILPSASYRLLAEFDDPIGKAYLRRESELSKLLGIRNGSFMVHGWSPVKEELFDRMLGVGLEFMNLSEDALPSLPQLRFDNFNVDPEAEKV